MPTCEFCKIVVTDGLDWHYKFCMSLGSDDGSIRSDNSDTHRHREEPSEQEPHQQPENNQPHTRHVDHDMHIDYDYGCTSERLGDTLLPWQYRCFSTKDDTESVSSSVFDESELENYFDNDNQDDGADDFPILNNPIPRDTIDFRFLPTLSDDEYWNVRLSSIAQKHVSFVSELLRNG
ncbi:hypothetical protein BJV82DRAFT_664042 [Fennellomyces sp. T-0311]|nr:hypothetical protein BJV82DRAFT_664042 [Fennellomyces sp. T-0311]